ILLVAYVSALGRRKRGRKRGLDPSSKGPAPFSFPFFAGRFVQKDVERGVAVLHAMISGEVLEAAQVGFANSIAGFLVIRVAVVDPAGERPWLARRAEIFLLKRAEIGRYGTLIRRGAGQKHVRLQVGEKENVAILLEAAAAAAGQADR